MTEPAANLYPWPQRQRRNTESGVTDDELLQAYRSLAGIVQGPSGEKFMPIFERLHREVQERKRIRSLKDIARAVTEGQDIFSTV